MKNLTEKGITLIALVITIIVLLILAGVTLNIVFNAGIIEKSQTSVDKYSEESAKEELSIALINYKMGVITGEEKTFEEYITDIGGTIIANTENSYIVKINEYKFNVYKDDFKANSILNESLVVTSKKAYTDLQEAIQDSENGETITLLKDYVQETTININDKNLILDLNGKTITGNTNTTLININQASNLTIKDTTGNGKIVSQNQNVISNWGILNITETAELTASINTINSIYVIDNKGTLNMTGGRIENFGNINDTSSNRNWRYIGIHNRPSATLNITKGSISSYGTGIFSYGLVMLGLDDEIVNTNDIFIQGQVAGLILERESKTEFYDGRIEAGYISVEQRDQSTIEIPDGYELKTTTENNIKTTLLNKKEN